MNILVLNCGSSSIKYSIFQKQNGSLENIFKGSIIRIYVDNSKHSFSKNGLEKTEQIDVENHSEALEKVFEKLLEQEVIHSFDEIDAVGHRVVHGGEKFKESVRINEQVLKGIKEVSDLAPLHNPENIKGIEACEKLLEDTPNIAVFDTAFHQTMDEKAYLYALPKRLYREHSIRRYGFHGTSHKYVSKKASEITSKKLENLKIITCHLGNGASIAAIDKGKVVDTSMGLTPLEGLVMGTRSGDIDPAIIPFIAEKEDLSVKEVETMLNKESGLKGLSEISSNYKTLFDKASKGNEKAETALNVFNYRVTKYIGSYAASMNGVDIIVFTGGIGENSSWMREQVLKNLTFLGFQTDEERNSSSERVITKKSSGKKALVIPTREGLVIAKETVEKIKESVA